MDKRIAQHNAEIGIAVPIVHTWSERNNMLYLRFNYVQEWFSYVLAQFDTPNTPPIVYNIYCRNKYVEMEVYT